MNLRVLPLWLLVDKTSRDLTVIAQFDLKMKRLFYGPSIHSKINTVQIAMTTESRKGREG
jgi:hypothetical protein